MDSGIWIPLHGATCAVDAFLEISTHLFLSYLSNLRTRNGFTDLLFNVCSHYISSREDSSLLREIREPVWSYIIDPCSSFAARVCNACFSQIFVKRTFGYLNEEEENLFMTQRTFESFCRSCSSSVTFNSSTLVTVVTAYGLNQLGLDNNMWPIFVTQIHTNSGRLNCTHCDTQTAEPVLRNVLNSCFLFIEFCPALMKDINVFEEIEISGAQYKLRGLVRCHNNHFTCAVKDHSACKWTYFDDLSVNLQKFSNFQSLRQVYKEGWSFSIYELRDMTIQCEGNDCTDHVLTTCANSRLNNETKISEPAHQSPAAKVVPSDEKQRAKRQHSKLLNDDVNSESESTCDSKISHSTSWSGAKGVHGNKNQKMQRQNLNVPKDGIYNESDSSCNSRISESTSLSGATVASINKKLNQAKRKHSNVLAAKKRNHSANEACENMTKNSRNNTGKSYPTTENGMPEGLKFDAAKKRKLSANEARENMTKNSRNITEKSYSTTENEMPEGLKFDAFSPPSQNLPANSPHIDIPGCSKSDSSVQNSQNPPTKGCSFHTDEEDDAVQQTPDIQISN